MILASRAIACDISGTKGTVSEDGQSVIERTPISVMEQARQYGGYQKAAEQIESNRLAIVNSTRYSASVRRQVSDDLSIDVAALECWAAACVDKPDNPACRF
ncbi:hypothetical protein J6352_25065 [Burkholderia pseudomallei]|uniref:hypothetical protein n=1 Tax=Burkholderia pseudomallei TaxID=28450 RepID=UPI001AD69732|nr:hypothetical protein [Burkholderia pseudomallei]MBO7774613.1 hypothetical protein [Burkholderia pseudomallei]MBO7908646.1 hypothetical protein [Burkholderia pseudomallei]